jgi:uncharacterized protein YfaS (alpha-2-macroglobulin family)
MNSLKSILTISIFYFFFNGCGTDNTVTIEDFFPQGKVDNLTTFTIEYSENLAPYDTLDKWLTEEFVIFEPKIAGRFKWTSGKTLIFSPDYPLEPIQSYKAKVTDKVLFKTNFSSDFDEYEFHTPDFDATKAEFFWTQIPNENYKISVKANIHFNYPVSPDALKQYLELRRDDKKVTNFKIMSDKPSDVIAINFGEIKQTDEEQELTVLIKEGLRSVIGKKPLQDEREFEQELPPITKLAITNVTSGYDGGTGWINVYTTQTVSEEKLKNYIKTEPKKEITFLVNENSFRIEGDFSETQTINLIIKKGLPGLFGGELEFDYEQEVTFVDLSPSINFADKRGLYLMRSGLRNLEVNSVNVPAAEVEVFQVFRNNLVYFLNQGTQWRYYYDDVSDYYHDYYEYSVNDYGNSLYKEKIDLSNRENWLEKFTINLDKALNPRFKGIFVINVRANEQRWINDSKIISMSDLGIIAKQSANQITVFINSISEAEPVADVEVSIISTNNQVILSGKTDNNGVITFENIKPQTEGFTTRLITAEKGDDFNFIDLRQTRIETSRFDVGGIYEYSTDYTAFIYSERNLYRPGDKVNISTIVRNDKIKIIKDIPVIIKVITPTGKTFSEFKKNLNNEGSFELSFELPDYTQTGEYVAEVYSGPNQLITSYRFSVEEFVPDKIRIMLKGDKEVAYPGDILSVDINSEFLFGAKASGLKYEGQFQYVHKNFYSKNYPDFDFTSSSIVNSNVQTKFRDGILDESGYAVIKDTVPGELSSKGVIEADAYVSVFDLTGRTVNRSVSFDIYPKKYFIGIKAPGYYFATNEKLNFNLVAVDEKDKPILDLKAKATLYRYQWQTVLKKDNYGKYYYASEKKELKEWERNVDISGGPKDFSFAVSNSGEYELRISKVLADNKVGDYQSKRFYAYGWGSTTASSFEVDKEGRVEIVADKKTYEPGEKAKVLFTTPFAGKMLITLERNGVYSHQYVDVQARSTEVELNLTEDYMPNVYVSATLFRKHNMMDTSPFLVGHGFASIKVEKKKNKLPLTITAPQKIKPNTKQEITIKTLPESNIYVTLAAVDEGILQIKNYETPDPYKYMYGKRTLRVESYDLYKLLLPEIVTLKSSVGGDGYDEELREISKRANPVTTKRFKLVSFWSGIKKTNSSGIVKVPLSIPQFNGDIRLMAVAYSDSRFGSAEEHMKVADDIIIEPEIPRFLSTNDSLVSTVTLINTTSSGKKVDISLKVEGPMQIISDKSQSVSIKPNSTSQVRFGIKTWNDIGAGKIILETGGASKVKEEIDIGVRPVSPLVVESGSGSIKAGENLNLKTPTDFLKGTQNVTLTISKFPAIKFGEHLKYLVGYPYGCIEQTVSKLFPQLYFEDLAKLVAPKLYKSNNPVYYVKEGIRKIESMQLYDGSMAYWQGWHETNWWGSVYAAHFLVEAQKAGFAVSDNVLKKLLSYIEKKNREGATYNYVTYTNNKRTLITTAYKEILYGLYVLALANKGDIATMNYYKSHPHLLATDSKYLLAGAYALMGKWNTYYEVVPSKFNPEKTDRQTGGCFDSEVRANAIMLNVLLEVEPSNSQIPYMIKHLSNLADKMYSTQERSFTFLALGKAAKITANTEMKVDVVVDGKTLGSFENKDITLTNAELNKGTITLKSSGKGEVYFFWNVEGIKTGKQVKEEDSFMQIRRTYYDYRTGATLSGNNFSQGQLIVCKITLAGSDRSAENIVITDLLPSCFEIENPRLSASTELRWTTKNPIIVQYLDIRDDRLLLFTNLDRNTTKEFYYMLRVVNKGKYTLPVIGAEAMYDREFHSYNGAGIVRVKE